MEHSFLPHLQSAADLPENTSLDSVAQEEIYRALDYRVLTTCEAFLEKKAWLAAEYGVSEQDIQDSYERTSLVHAVAALAAQGKQLSDGTES